MAVGARHARNPESHPEHGGQAAGVQVDRCPSDGTPLAELQPTPLRADSPTMPSTSDSILKLEVPIVVRIGEREMKLHEVLALTAGAIVEVPKLADAELDLMVNNQVIGHGTAVKVGEKFGILVTFVGTPAERAAALAAGQNHAEPESGDDTAAEDLAAQLLAGQV